MVSLTKLLNVLGWPMFWFFNFLILNVWVCNETATTSQGLGRLLLRQSRRDLPQLQLQRLKVPISYWWAAVTVTPKSSENSTGLSLLKSSQNQDQLHHWEPNSVTFQELIQSFLGNWWRILQGKFQDSPIQIPNSEFGGDRLHGH